MHSVVSWWAGPGQPAHSLERHPMSFDSVLLPAEAIREIRARGCTTPGVAEILVRHHGAGKVLSNLHDIPKLLEAIFVEDLVLAEELQELLDKQPPPAESATLTFLNAKGETMPLTVHVNDTPGKAVLQEFAGPSGTGQIVPPTGVVSYSSSNPAVATVDPSSGALAYVSPGTAVISGSDAGSGLSASDTLTVTAAPAVSATLTLEPGVPPAAQAGVPATAPAK